MDGSFWPQGEPRARKMLDWFNAVRPIFCASIGFFEADLLLYRVERALVR